VGKETQEMKGQSNLDTLQIRQLFPNASKSLLAANDDNHTQNPRQNAPLERNPSDAPLAASEVQGTASNRILVRVTSVRSRLADEDGLCEKYHVDCLRYAGLIPDDSPAQTKIETTQRKAAKGEEEHTEIVIILP